MNRCENLWNGVKQPTTQVSRPCVRASLHALVVSYRSYISFVDILVSLMSSSPRFLLQLL